MSDRPIFTYQTRLTLDAVQAQALDDYASLHGRAERSLFAALRAGRTLNDLKREFLPRFGITARQFNAIRVGLEGKIDSIKARRPELIAETKQRIKRAETVLGKLEVRAAGTHKLHQKKLFKEVSKNYAIELDASKDVKGTENKLPIAIFLRTSPNNYLYHILDVDCIDYNCVHEYLKKEGKKKAKAARIEKIITLSELLEFWPAAPFSD